MGAQSIIMVAVPAGLGGSLLVALNALNPVLAIGGGGTPWRSRPVGSLDIVSIIDDGRASSLSAFARHNFHNQG